MEQDIMDDEEQLPESYKRLRDVLRDEDFYAGEKNSLDTVFRIVTRMNDWDANVGHSYSRVNHNDREKAFYDVWMKWNEPVGGINNGNGILQDLFIEQSGTFSRKWILEVNHRERMIVATIIQWLGSNVGFSFLQEALRECGYTIQWPERKETGRSPEGGNTPKTEDPGQVI